MSTTKTPLQRYRHAQTPKLTLKAISDQVGISESQMSRIERVGTDSLPIALKLAAITGLSVTDFAKPEARP